MELILPRYCSRNEAIRWILPTSLASLPRYGRIRGYISWLVGVLKNAGSMAQDLVVLTCVKIDVTTQRPPRNRMTVLLSLETQDLLPPPPRANISSQEG